MKAPDETPFSTGISGHESMLSVCLWCVPGDHKQQFHIYSISDDYPIRNLNAITDTHTTHNGSGPVPGEFSPALSFD